LSDDAVGPCGAIGSVDVSDTDYGHDFCACGANPIIWKVEDYDKAGFITASINSSGVLTWTTKGPETAGEYYCIVVKACCGHLSAYMNVLIGVKDLCSPCGCPEGCEDCDPCTGLCVEPAINMALNSSSSSANNSISAS